MEQAGVTWGAWIRSRTDPREARQKPEALEGLLVLDASYASMAGLFCSSLLAELGAEVVRVEPPEGDVARRYTPEALLHHETGLAYLAEGRNKLHVTLALDRPEGQDLFRRLAKRADVVVETFPAGTMDGWGIGYRQLREANPGLIYLAMTTHGQFGPRAGRETADADVVDQALSGLMSITGADEEEVGPQSWAVPTKSGNWMAWYVGGAFGAMGVLVALQHRSRTGEGQLVDVSPAEALMRCGGYEIPYYHAYRAVRERVGNRDVSVYPYSFIAAKDGYVFVSGYTDDNWTALTTIIERPDLRERYPTIFDRLRRENQIAIQKELDAWASQYTCQEIIEKVRSYQGKGTVAVGRIHGPMESLRDPHWWERGFFQEVEDPTYGRVTVQGPAWKMSETPPRIKWACRRVGQDNELVFTRYLGLSRSRLQELRARGVM